MELICCVKANINLYPYSSCHCVRQMRIRNHTTHGVPPPNQVLPVGPLSAPSFSL